MQQTSRFFSVLTRVFRKPQSAIGLVFVSWCILFWNIFQKLCRLIFTLSLCYTDHWGLHDSTLPTTNMSLRCRIVVRILPLGIAIDLLAQLRTWMYLEEEQSESCLRRLISTWLSPGARGTFEQRSTATALQYISKRVQLYLQLRQLCTWLRLHALNAAIVWCDRNLKSEGFYWSIKHNDQKCHQTRSKFLGFSAVYLTSRLTLIKTKIRLQSSDPLPSRFVKFRPQNCHPANRFVYSRLTSVSHVSNRQQNLSVCPFFPLMRNMQESGKTMKDGHANPVRPRWHV